jgi:hypothetical protein
MAQEPRRATVRFFTPLLDKQWVAEGDGPMGSYTCKRRFERVLEGKYVRMTVLWQFGDKTYEEIAMFGRDPAEKRLTFWSFTSDGKNSRGVNVDADDIPNGAVAFEAQMPAGLARMILWTSERRSRLHVTVESATKKGWNSLLEQRHTIADE